MIKVNFWNGLIFLFSGDFLCDVGVGISFFNYLLKVWIKCWTIPGMFKYCLPATPFWSKFFGYKISSFSSKLSCWIVPFKISIWSLPSQIFPINMQLQKSYQVLLSKSTARVPIFNSMQFLHKEKKIEKININGIKLSKSGPLIKNLQPRNGSSYFHAWDASPQFISKHKS